MAPKSKKPQVKVPTKAPAKSTLKSILKNISKTVTKNITKKSAPVKPAKAPKAAPVSAKTAAKKAPVKVAPVAKPTAKELKAAAKAAPVIAAVLAKPAVAGKIAKGAKPAKAPKAGASTDRMCRELACENIATTKGYCRLDYIKNWKKIKRKEMILKEGKLNQYIEELVGKYPDKYIDVIRQDLSTEVNFNKVIHDLELDESIDDLDYDSDSIDALIGGIKKDIEDFGDEEF